MTAQERGRELEREVAKLLGADLVPGSGAFFSKMDVQGQGVLWSAKHSDSEHVKVNHHLFDECLAAIHGPGGLGGSYYPGVVTRCSDGLVIASLRLSDLADLLHERRPVSSKPSQTHVNLSRRTPSLLRDQSGES